ncbi:MAG: LysM domain-containing protein [Clostridia bacterium]|nr:LysM domain-containing protein [Clostridia bacterium]
MFYQCNRQCPPNTVTYIVKPGDVLFRIAQSFNTTVSAIVSLNPGINPAVLYVGQIICIPTKTPMGICPVGIFPYKVKHGDTFFSIAQRYGITVDLLVRANPTVNPNVLFVGQKLCIPGSAEKYMNPKYQISLFYPVTWQFINDTRYEGDDGFFQISAVSGSSLNEICRNEAFHALTPYGTRPEVINTQIYGQEACFILPSPDQPPEMEGQAALVVRYPTVVSINGQNYNFFILWADKDHIQEIANTIRFHNK